MSVDSPSVIEISDFIETNVMEKDFFSNFKKSDLENMKPHFPKGTVFRSPDSKTKTDLASDIWIQFPEYPFKYLKLEFPFPNFITQFFKSTNMSYGQASPMLWRILFVLNIIMTNRKLELKVPDLGIVYTLTTFGSGF